MSTAAANPLETPATKLPASPLAKSASLERATSPPKSPNEPKNTIEEIFDKRSESTNGLEADRDSSPTDSGGAPRRRSPSYSTKDAANTLVQMSSANNNNNNNENKQKKSSTPTSQLSKQSSQSSSSVEKSPPTRHSVGKKSSVEEVREKLSLLSTSPPKHQQRKSQSPDANQILSNRDDALTCNSKPSKNLGKFLTDREYLKTHEPEEELDHDLEVWQPDPSIPFDDLEGDIPDSRGGGKLWGAAQMFAENERLGVESTYNGIDKDYCNTVPVGTAEQIRRAEQLADEMEGSANSRRYEQLENDDEERDLDKETRFDGGGRSAGAKRQSAGSHHKGGNRSGSGNSNSTNSGGGGAGRNHANSASGRNSGAIGAPSSNPSSGTGRYPNTNNNGSQQSRRPAAYGPSAGGGGSSLPPAPTTTSWRTDANAPQQPPYTYSKQPSSNTSKSPSLYTEERRQSASPATSSSSNKYQEYQSGDGPSTTGIRRANSVQNRQNQPQPQSQQQQSTSSHSPHPETFNSGGAYEKRSQDARYGQEARYSSQEGGRYQQQEGGRYQQQEGGRYQQESASSSSLPPQTASSQVETQPIITPIPKQSSTTHDPTTGQAYIVEAQQFENESGGQSEDQANADKKKKFAFNPDAQPFVPKTTSVQPPRQIHTPQQSMTPVHQQQIGMPPQQQPQQVHPQHVSMAAAAGLPPHQQYHVMPMPAQVMSLQNSMMMAQQPAYQAMSQAQVPSNIPQQQMGVVQQRIYQPLDANGAPIGYMDNGGKLVMDNGAQLRQQYAQQAIQGQMMPAGQQIRYVQPVPPQMQINTLTHPQITGNVQPNQPAGLYATSNTGLVSASMPYQQGPQNMYPPQQMYYGTYNGQM